MESFVTSYRSSNHFGTSPQSHAFYLDYLSEKHPRFLLPCYTRSIYRFELLFARYLLQSLSLNFHLHFPSRPYHTPHRPLTLSAYCTGHISWYFPHVFFSFNYVISWPCDNRTWDFAHRTLHIMDWRNLALNYCFGWKTAAKTSRVTLLGLIVFETWSLWL